MAASAPRQPPSRGHSRRAVRQCSAASADCASQREARRCSAAQAIRRGASSAAERLDCTSCRSASGIQAGGVSADRLSPGAGQKTANAGSCAARRNSSGPVSACASSSSARYVSRLFALWAATQNDALYGVAAASPSVWFPGWPEYEAAHPIQAQRVYLSLGDREEHTKNQTMASVGDNIRALTRHGTACTLEWNTGGHFKDVDLRTARAFAWVMEGKQ